MDVYECIERKTRDNVRKPASRAKALVQRPLGRSRPAIRRPAIRPPRVPRLPQPRRRATWRDVTAGDVAGYGVKAYEMAKQLVRLINVEEKRFEADGSSGTVVTTTPIVHNLSNVAQGADYYQRTGDSVRPLYLDLRFTVLSNAATQHNSLRIMIVQDKENQGTDPTMGLVLQGVTDPLVALPNALYQQRFKYLFDDVIELNNDTSLASSGTSTTYNVKRSNVQQHRFKLSGHILYDDTAGADASNLEGALFLMAVSRDATNGPTLAYTTRLTFTDN